MHIRLRLAVKGEARLSLNPFGGEVDLV